jgi:hypothetical protein
LVSEIAVSPRRAQLALVEDALRSARARPGPEDISPELEAEIRRTEGLG